MTKILLLAGGISDEHEVSLRSGAWVRKALEAANHDVTTMDPSDKNFDVIAASQGFDVVFPVLHGKGGEDGSLQSQLDNTDIPYVGTGPHGSRLCFDKWQYRNKLLEAGLAVARGELVDIESFWQSPLSKRPFVLKPHKGGSSIDTIIVRDIATISAKRINDVFSRYEKLLIEELVLGIEITIAVLNGIALPVIEIIPPEGLEFDYENKYNGASQELCPPLHVPVSVQLEAQSLSQQIHKLCACGDYSRTDMIADELGKLTVLETNTIPGMTEQSLFPKAAATAGISMPTLCNQLVEMALTHQTERA